ncbi:MULTISPECIES: hypothetical protein [unclassified Lysinibacillus]
MKANKLEEAYRSYQKGIELAKKSAVQEAVQDFNDLIKKLENQKK